VHKVLVSWSSGKDSALALYEVLQGGEYEVSALLTTVTEAYDRISMHGVRNVFLEQQAHSLGFPLERVLISKDASNEEYESRMHRLLSIYQHAGVRSVAFGDIFLEDVRNYREGNLAKLGMNGLFPLWKRDTHELVRSFIHLGFKAVVTCVDTNALGRQFVGRHIDEQFLSDLPSGVDPCGENGEYHSFVYDGPLFRERIRFTTGEVVLRENRFAYMDLLPRYEAKEACQGPA